MEKWRLSNTPTIRRLTPSSRHQLSRIARRSLKDHRHRQPPDGDPGRTGQGRQGPLRHALSAAPEDFTLLLYWRLARPKRWPFPGRDDERPLVPNVLHAACRSACAAAGLSKPVTVHLEVSIRDPSLGERGGRAHHPGCCLAMPVSQAWRATPGSPPKRSLTRRARSIGSAWKSYRPALAIGRYDLLAPSRTWASRM